MQLPTNKRKICGNCTWVYLKNTFQELDPKKRNIEDIPFLTTVRKKNSKRVIFLRYDENINKVRYHFKAEINTQPGLLKQLWDILSEN